MYSTSKYQHEFQNSQPPSTCYFVFSTPRCGSSLLCEALFNTGLAGAPTEYFDQDTRDRFAQIWHVDSLDKSLDDYLQELLKRKSSSNGVFGSKAHFHQYELTFGVEKLPSVFTNLKFILVSRRDVVRQAVSYFRAIETNQWASHLPSSNESPIFDYKKIDQLRLQTEQEQQRMDEFFLRHQIEPLRLTYEDFCDTPQQAARDCLQFLDVKFDKDLEIQPITLKKQADELSQRWVQQYLQCQSEEST